MRMRSCGHLKLSYLYLDSMSTLVMSVLDTQTFLNSLLSLQASVDRPSEDICIKIASLQGLAETGDSARVTDWRRGSGAYQAQQQQKWRKPGQGHGHMQEHQPHVNVLEQPRPVTTAPPLGRYHSRFRNSNPSKRRFSITSFFQSSTSSARQHTPR